MPPNETKPIRKRRGRGEGSIYQLPDGRWAAMISIGIGADGKRKRRAVYGDTKSDVQEELRKLQTANLTGMLVHIKREILAAFLARWLTDVAKPTLRATTFANYRGIVEKHVSPRIGGVQLQKLTAMQVQGLYADMARDRVGPHARRLAHAVLSRAMKHAVRQRLVGHNVCEDVEPPKVTKAKIQPLDQKQVGALLGAAEGDRLEALYHLAIGSGMREGEMFGLHSSAIDLAAGTVSVQQSLSEVGGKLILGDVKSPSARRLIDLPQHAIAALEAHRKRQMAAGFGGVDFVFTNQSGGPLRRSHLHAGEFKPLLKRAGLPLIRFHDLRHTHATLCLLAGENPKVVQERLGHANIGITMDTYSHVMPSLRTTAAAKIDGIIRTAVAENGKSLARNAG